jgi:uncharacterized membrane protein
LISSLYPFTLVEYFCLAIIDFRRARGYHHCIIENLWEGILTEKSIQSNRIDSSRIMRAGINSVFAALAANLILRFILGALLDLPAEFPALQYPAIAFFTILGTSAGVLVFYLISRRAHNPIRTYWMVAMAALVLSIIPNIFMFGVLIVFHLVAGFTSVWVLTRSVLRP